MVTNLRIFRTTFRISLVFALVLIYALTATTQSEAKSGAINFSKPLSGNVVLARGIKQTIPSGTRVTLKPHATLTIAGTLTSTQKVTFTGSGWNGIVVAPTGNLSISGAIIGASTAITVNSGGKATLKNASVSREFTPFNIQSGGTLKLIKVTVARAQQNSSVEGSFTASHLTYNKGAGNGFNSYRGTAVYDISHSNLSGDGNNSGDMLSLLGAKSLKLTATSITTSHCALHLIGLKTLTMTSTTLTRNSYGFMLYGASGTIRNSNIYGNADFGIDAQGNRGHVIATNNFISQNPQNLAGTGSHLVIHAPAKHKL